MCAGDKTLAMWLLDAEIYDGMSTFEPASAVVERGMAMHKMIHALTMVLGAPSLPPLARPCTRAQAR